MGNNRAIRLATVVDAGIDEVWQAWTTEEGAKTFFAPAAKIELCRKGPYELYFDMDQPPGLRGSEGCTVLDFEPNSRLEFTWNFPPHLSIRNELTRVKVEFASEGPNQTEIQVEQTGWKDGTDWEDGFQYFQRAWATVLGRLQHRFAKAPIDWSHPYTPSHE